MNAGNGQLANVLDNRALAELRATTRHDASRETARAVAKQFESLFIQTMLKSMRDATPSEGLFGGKGVEQYQGLFDQQMASNVAQGQGLGLAPVIERQILRQQGIAPDPDRKLDTGLERYSDRVPAMRIAPEASSDRPVAAPDVVPAATRGALADGPGDFVERLWPEAERAAARLNVDPRALVAQSALETGWGQHVLKHADGRSSFNVFNIKANSGWRGDTVNVPTLEYRGGEAIREQASFRSYDSLEAAFDDYVNFLQSHPRYADALRAGGDAGRYVQALQDAGYATDPRYAEKIRTILNGDRVSAEAVQLKNPGDGSTHRGATG